MKFNSADKYLSALFLFAAILTGAFAADFAVRVDASGKNPVAAPTPKKTAAKIQNFASPESLVIDLYKKHDAQKGPFFQTKNRALVDQYFTKNTADLIWKDAVTANGEVGALDGDPLYNAQDTEIKRFSVGRADIDGEAANLPVSFTNLGEKHTFIFVLRRENGKWKIDDIKYDGDGDFTLLKIYGESASSGGGDQSVADGEFEGAYQIGATTCTVKPIKMAFAVKWKNGKGEEIFFAENADGQYKFVSDPKTGKPNTFLFDDENYNTGTFYRADGKEFPIKRIENR